MPSSRTSSSGGGFRGLEMFCVAVRPVGLVTLFFLAWDLRSTYVS
jgi:hypothetical protein